MRLTICHLSDIHFDHSKNILLDRQKKLCDAILQDAFKRDFIIFIVSGDISQSGQEEEYKIAHKFFMEIKEYLIKKKEIKVLFFSHLEIMIVIFQMRKEIKMITCEEIIF